MESNEQVTFQAPLPVNGSNSTTEFATPTLIPRTNCKFGLLMRRKDLLTIMYINSDPKQTFTLYYLYMQRFRKL